MDAQERLKGADETERARRRLIHRLLESPILVRQHRPSAEGQPQTRVPRPSGRAAARARGAAT